MERKTEVERKTKETHIKISLAVDGQGKADIASGIPFFDHMLTTLAFHAGWSLTLNAEGDLVIDDHHTIEDCAIAQTGCHP